MECKVEICLDKVKAWGYCNRHGQQVYHHGKVTNPFASPRSNRLIQEKTNYALVPLTSSKFDGTNIYAKIDIQSVRLVSNYKWTMSGKYARSTTDKIYLHRLITNAPNGTDVDHVNGDTLDNRLSNLRLCSHKQNTWNSRIRHNSKSGYKGVSFDTQKGKYVSYITQNKKRHYLGSFISKDEAARKYNEAAIKYFGKYAYVNQI